MLIVARIAAALLFPILSACTVETGPVYSPPPSNPRPPQICTMEYAPVCGERGGRSQTFPNACQARASGFMIVGRGECRPTRPPPPPPSPGPQICTREYVPVCGERAGRTRTFPNACEARRDGFRVVAQGECRAAPPPPPPSPGPQMCTMEYAPVCGERGGRVQTFPNACEARNGGFRIVAQGECRR
ncbi:Kazal-type serine protease inhibitor domain-containing protein [Rhizobium sp. BK251]|uniref:Kazal-type serine protease inhibitor domain-containing protein n=1 Tax=Rhizobium sp. BK251 TaxID=2512125 RepID=UPI001FE00837|nr:Kazal-type serine protease inhibitor domain-containing protein [Rhizobium sp. BK251]